MGMMQTPSQGGYNGTVTVNGQPVQVSDGVANVQGQQYLVSDDGSMVVDNQRHIIGYVDNGQFKPMDAQQTQKLKSMGVTE